MKEQKKIHTTSLLVFNSKKMWIKKVRLISSSWFDHGLWTPNEGINQIYVSEKLGWCSRQNMLQLYLTDLGAGVNFQCQLMLQAFLYFCGFDFRYVWFTPVYYFSTT